METVSSLPSSNPDFSLSAYDYHLPSEQIAQNPAVPRDSSRLLVVDAFPNIRHEIFRALPEQLKANDLLVLNNTRVIPARLYGNRVGGGKAEVLLLEELRPDRWLALVKPGKRLKSGARIEFGSPELISLQAQVLEVDEATGGRILQFELPTGQPLVAVLAQLGQVPLPPYITQSQAEPEQYQTVYGDRPGSAAAPTAGLHFTPELLARLQAQGISRAFVTLHVGVGTFRPVEAENITAHQMHGEWVEVPLQTVEKVQQTKARGGRVIAVGTTAARSLEGASQGGTLVPYCGKTELFIYPGYRWRTVDGLITNFHLPKSSLLMLVSALVGRQRLMDLYEMAIAKHYRFYSFGDAMLILPEARHEIVSP
ncbi:MAG: tRNA preQ1(34) S-adenosylmethionine ribosyltransferase-isomerase QueA [Leptolyngbyaceae cyanobacterium CSU_1_4]|nr:tRNA preQ1(34) S-adenosylmethionine ribosyltransferase-isomerase QueA [Leptolyngbyaceae cyanobacterium CSU_1_4]